MVLNKYYAAVIFYTRLKGVRLDYTSWKNRFAVKLYLVLQLSCKYKTRLDLQTTRLLKPFFGIFFRKHNDKLTITTTNKEPF